MRLVKSRDEREQAFNRRDGKGRQTKRLNSRYYKKMVSRARRRAMKQTT